MKINKLYSYYLRNDAHLQFFNDFRTLVQKTGAENLKIAPQFTAWQPLHDREDAALKKIVKSAVTAQIQEADKARDEIYTGILEMNSAALKHFNETVRSAASRLKIVFDTYGNIAKKTLNEETSAVYNILQELKGKYAADSATVGISAWVAELETRNNAFAALMQERFDETAAQIDIVLKDARAEVDAAYFAMRERINALIIVEGGAAYENFVKTLNAIIAKYNALVAAARSGKKGRKASAEDEEEAEPEPEEN